VYLVLAWPDTQKYRLAVVLYFPWPDEVMVSHEAGFTSSVKFSHRHCGITRQVSLGDTFARTKPIDLNMSSFAGIRKKCFQKNISEHQDRCVALRIYSSNTLSVS